MYILNIFSTIMMTFLGKLINMLFGPYVYWFEMQRKDGLENYGDVIGPYLFTKISGKKPKNLSLFRPYKFTKYIKNYITVGSIINVCNEKSIVWGSGFLGSNEPASKADFKAVRGPLTRNKLLAMGYNIPEIYGDPALLLPLYFTSSVNKKFKIGIIPHYKDYAVISSYFKGNDEIKVIDLITDNIEKTTAEILECETIISSSLHGIIVPHAYSIPALWVKFSNKLPDDIKFYDYFKSINLNVSPVTITESLLTSEYLYQIISENKEPLLPDFTTIEAIRKQLLEVCPFKPNT